MQYQGLAAPLLVSAAAETLTLDKWQGRQVVPVRRIVSVAAIAMACVLPPTFAEGTANPPTGWQPQTSEAPRLRPSIVRCVTAQPMFGVEIDVPVQSWTGSFPDLLLRRRALTPLAAASGPLYVADVTVVAPALAWSPRYPDRIPPARGLRPSQQQAYAADKFTPPAAVTVPDLSWLSGYPDRTSRHILTPEGRAVAPLHVPDVTSPVTALSWQPDYPDRIPPARGLVAAWQRAYTSDTLTTPGAVVVPDLSWAPSVVPARLYGRTLGPIGGPTAPLYVADVTVVAPAQWAPSYPAFILARPLARIGWEAVDPTALMAASSVVVTVAAVKMRLVPRSTRVLLVPGFAGTAPASADATYAERVIADGAVAYWRLGELTGAVAADEVDDHHGTIAGGVTLGQIPGAITDGNAAMLFDGSTGYVHVGNVAALRPTSVSFEAWVKPSNVAQAVAYVGGCGNTGFAGYLLVTDLTSLTWRVGDGTSKQAVLYGDASPLVNGVWMHVVGTYSPAAGPHLYLNGVEVIHIVSNTMAGAAIGYGAVTDFRIAQLHTLIAARYWTGSLDEVAIYPTALAAAQIAAHYAMGRLLLQPGTRRLRLTEDAT